MKNIMNFALLSVAIALTGCGGDSDSSGEVYQTGFFKTLVNQNKYQCPSKDTLQLCTSDKTCQSNHCKLIKEVTPVSDGTLKACRTKLSEKKVAAYANESCQFKNQSADADLVVTCIGNNKMILDGHIGNAKFSNSVHMQQSMKINHFQIRCL